MTSMKIEKRQFQTDGLFEKKENEQTSPKRDNEQTSPKSMVQQIYEKKLRKCFGEACVNSLGSTYLLAIPEGKIVTEGKYPNKAVKYSDTSDPVNRGSFGTGDGKRTYISLKLERTYSHPGFSGSSIVDKWIEVIYRRTPTSELRKSDPEYWSKITDKDDFWRGVEKDLQRRG